MIGWHTCHYPHLLYITLACLQVAGQWIYQSNFNQRIGQGFFVMHITRLYTVKTDIFQNAFFGVFFIINELPRVDLIIKVVLEFLSNL